MTETDVIIDGVSCRLVSVSTLVIGSGAAGLNAAVSLHARGHADVLIVTDQWGGGTSANAGSDKQTYYKLSLAGDIPDSPKQMAEDLAAGGCMHGDIALCEAQHSAQAFYHLVSLGVPFPHDEYGGYPGYRTDHDPRGRATSAGPLTSRLMVEALGRSVRERRIPVLDRHQVVALLVDTRAAEPTVAGAVALELPDEQENGSQTPRFVVVNAVNVVLATGGPGDLYADSVYPEGQEGAIGLALRIGAVAQNLTESQFGLASVGFRWNVSGSYQQVIPRYVSTDASGGDEREFLNDAFPDMATLATAIFRKGYEWPFDARKVAGCGSSLIDLLVTHERRAHGRRVFLDYTRNPVGDARIGRFDLEAIEPEARQYLASCGATGATPIERLAQMNQPAIDLYRAHGIDLASDRLEIAVCAQHCNGGLAGDRWWQSNVRGLFPVGEVNGSHGVYRPGGAALNAGQVGGLRAAMFIAARRNQAPPEPGAFLDSCRAQVASTLAWARRTLGSRPAGAPDVQEVRRQIQARMSACAAHIRRPALVRQAVGEAWALCRALAEASRARDSRELAVAFRNADLALAHACYLEAIDEYIAQGGRSRGSYVVAGGDGNPFAPVLNGPDDFVNRHILELWIDSTGSVKKRWVPTRPIPHPDGWFETVWRQYRADGGIR